MTFEELKRRHRELDRLRRAGELSPEEFREQALQLRLQTPDQTWWQLKLDGRGWLRWTGSGWVEDEPPQQPTAAAPQEPPAGPGRRAEAPSSAAADTPETLLQLIGIIVRNTVAGVVRNLPRMALIFVVVWVVHTYLLAGPNNGFWKVSNEFLGMILALKTRMIGGTLFWILLTGVFSSTMMRIREGGLGKFFREMGRVPSLVGTAADRVPVALRVIFPAAAVTLVLGAALQNRFVSLLAALALCLSLSLELRGFAFLVVRLGWSDLYRLLKRPGLRRFDAYRAQLIIAGAMLGLFAAAVLPFLPYTGYLGALVLFGAALARGPQAATNAVFFLVTVGGILVSRKVFGHDGGVWEAGGWSNWVGSRGFIQALLHGVPPGAGAAVGTVLASAGSTTATVSGQGLLLSGNDAVAWLTQQGLLDDGVLTDKFWNEWDSLLPSEDGPNPYGLQAVAGDWDRDNRDQPIGDISIIIDAPHAVEEEVDTGDAEVQETPPEEDSVDLMGEEADATDEEAGPDDDAGTEEGEPTEEPPPEEPPAPEEEPPADEPEEPPADEDKQPPPPPEDPEPPEAETEEVELTPEQINVKLDDLRDRMQDIIDKKKDDGYFVRNPDLIRKAWNNTLGRFSEWWSDLEGGQCGEFAGWGEEWSEDHVAELFGEGSITNQIVLQKNSLQNHAATHVILPNGDRYVMDYWESMQTGKPEILTEKEWLDKWKEELGGGEVATDELSYMEQEIKKYVEQHGPEEGAKEFLNDFDNTDQARTLVRSYRRSPW